MKMRIKTSVAVVALMLAPVVSGHAPTLLSLGALPAATVSAAITPRRCRKNAVARQARSGTGPRCPALTAAPRST